MSEELEQRIRRAVRNVDAAQVGPSEEVLRRAARRVRTMERNRRVALGGATLAVIGVAIAGVVAISGRDTRDRSVGTGSLPTAATPVTTVPQTNATTTAPETAAAAPSRWRPIAAHPEGIGWDVAAAWLGDEAFVLGRRAYSYAPADDAWRELAPFPESWTPLDGCSTTPATCIGDGIGQNPNGYSFVDPIVVWTGEKVLVLGGDQSDPQGDRAANCPGLGCHPKLVISTSFGYVPAEDRWQLLAAPPWFVNSRSPYAWTGTELFVWPWDIDDTPDPPYAYDPRANTWRQLPDAPIPPRQNAASVWTGSEWIIWGGGDDSGELSDGAAYNPTTDSWRLLAEAPISARKVQGVWSGSELIVMAGSNGGGTSVCCGSGALSDGAAYDPATDTWRRLAGTVGHPGFEPLWTGDDLLMFAKGGVVVYDPITEEYVDVCCDGMAGSAHVWTGTEAVSFGSYTADRGGGIFTPP